MNTIICEKCGNIIKNNQKCYQLRYGYMHDDEFHAELDVEYFHEKCQ